MLSLPSSSVSQRYKYDVFLSFRGEDTRKSFTDHLYAALKGGGIVTFRDNERLEAGEEIGPELFKAIEESWCSIIVFSKTYAFSGWCLDEAAKIVKQKNERGHKVFPIFYDVDPSHLRKQKGKVGEAFAKHEETFKDNKLKTQKWRYALTQLANLKGWHLNNRHESEFIRDIVKKISEKLCQTHPVIHDDLIGIKTRLEELHSMIEIGEDDVRIIGICGMGGLGKTTLARAVYAQMSPHFDGKCFLADVREVSEKYGLVSLQKQLLSQTLSEEGGFNLFNVYDGNDMISRRLSLKRVLVVIDNVDNIQHLKCLVGRRDWFGSGSRIIITTRDESLLQFFGVDDMCKPKIMNANEALSLFRLKAFSNGAIPDDFVKLSELVVNYADGLPLALEVLGSFLRGRDIAQWRSAIERLKRVSNKEILDRLRISFDGLEETEKNIFLDIACFFKGEDKNFVMKILDGCEFFPKIGIDMLIKKSLITVDKYGKVRMHDLLQEMGRKIVQQKSVDEPGNRCRLWEERDVYHVLTENMVTESVEGMIIDIKSYQITPQIFNYFWEEKKMFNLGAYAFSKMKKLRLLRVFNPSNFGDVNYLSNELTLLEWHGYPFKALPSSFQADNLVALLLPYSRIEQLWKGNRVLEKLKLVHLKGSQNLVKTPTFIVTPNLKNLILESCTRLVHVHPSIGVLKRLKLLDLRDCRSLKSFPNKIEMESLEKLILSGCSSLEKFPDIDAKMEHLVELYLDGTCIRALPSSIGNLSSLVLLNLKGCKYLESLPNNMEGLKCLKTLNLCGCSKIESLPEGLQQLESLEELDLSETAITKPQSFIFEYKNLKVLSFNGCKGPPSKLQAKLLSLFMVRHRGGTNSTGMVLPSLSGLTSLTELYLSDCNLRQGAIPNDFCGLSSLGTLDLSGNNFISIPLTLGQLSKLNFLRLSDCKELKSLPELPTSILSLIVEGCDSLEAFAYPTKICDSMYFSYIDGVNCYKLVENNNALSILKNYVKVFAKADRDFNIVLPGSVIPKWFRDQREGCTIKIKLPPLLWNDSKWMGIAFCCNFVSPFKDNDACGDYDITCEFSFPGKYPKSVIRNRYKGFDFGEKSRRQQVLKDHLWLSYWSREYLDLYPLKFGDDEYDEFELLFTTRFGVPPKINKCGVRVVYENDLEEIEELVQGAPGKRKRNIYEEDEAAGPSECQGCAEQTPPQKRLEKVLKFMMGKKH